ncbi:guanylate-binding protein 2-like [Chenopodium quinoa]|uniref:guanylate-binding protein 2-like n=1 Tax=Chenopodium quinoa TaxID=63459 RepID=UPI000B774B1D|nr:guanylate-binding protein 2-like [Chenopodium quinoa]
MRLFRGKETADSSPSPENPPQPSPPPPAPSVTGPARPIRFVYSDEDGKFRIDPEALAVLQLVKEPIGVVAVCGRARQGKSFILNQLLGRSSGFQVASTHRPCTKGLWLWSTPLKKTALDGTEYNLILLDTEGIDAYDQTGTYSTQIFSLAVLLSSLFIFNQMGGIDEAALDQLSLVTEMTKHIRVRAPGGRTTASELGQFSPIFVWLLRDFYLDLVEDGRKITPRDYLELALRPVQGSGKDIVAKNEIRESIRALFPDRECFTLVRPLNSETELQHLDQTPLHNFRPEFRSGLDALTRFAFERTRPKQIGATVMNGPMLAGLTQSFLDALNNGAVPTISSSWQSVEETECRKAFNRASEEYTSSFDKSKPPEEAALREAHEDTVQNALSIYNSNAVGAGSARQKYEMLLQNYCRKEFENYRKNTYMEADIQCSTAIQNMEKQLRTACLVPNAELVQVLKVLDDLLSEYEASCYGPGKEEKKAVFLQRSFEDLIAEVARKQLDKVGTERSALKLKCQSLEENVVLLTKKLEASEKQKSEYLKRYDDALSDKRKIADDYANQVSNLQSKYSSLDERYSSVSKTLDSVKKESSGWKKKYEDILLKQKAEEDEASAEIGVLKSRASAAEASLAALREQAQSAKEEAEEWKRKYDIAAKDAKSALGKTAVVQETTNKNMQLREDMLRAEFVKTLAVKEEELKEKMAKVDQVEQQLTTLQLGLKAAESRVINYDMEVSDLKNKIKVLEEELEAANARAKSFERQSKILEQEKTYLEEKYQPEFMMIDELQERCKAAEIESRKAVEVADQARAEAEIALKEKSDIQKMYMERLAHIEKAERQIENLERQKKDLADELSRIRASEMDAKSKVILLEARVEEREKEIESRMKLNNAERSSTVQVLNELLETERSARAEANRRAEALSVQLQTTQGKLDLVQQELASVRFNESALEAKLEASKSNGKRSNVEATEMKVDSAEDDRLITRVKKKLKSIGSPFRQTASPEDVHLVFGSDEDVEQINSEDYTKFTVQKLKQELVKHNFGAELLKLANPSKNQVLALYERCVLHKY